LHESCSFYSVRWFEPFFLKTGFNPEPCAFLTTPCFLVIFEWSTVAGLELLSWAVFFFFFRSLAHPLLAALRFFPPYFVDALLHLPWSFRFSLSFFLNLVATVLSGRQAAPPCACFFFLRCTPSLGPMSRLPPPLAQGFRPSRPLVRPVRLFPPNVFPGQQQGVYWIPWYLLGACRYNTPSTPGFPFSFFNSRCFWLSVCAFDL